MTTTLGSSCESSCRQATRTSHGMTMQILALLALAGFVQGCSDEREKQVAVTGTVFYRGEPIDDARVTFYRTGARPASGTTDKSGRFTLRTYDPDDGAVIGLHEVTISKSKRNPKHDLTNPERMFVDLLPRKYAQPHTSELTAEVSADGENDFRFDLDD